MRRGGAGGGVGIAVDTNGNEEPWFASGGTRPVGKEAAVVLYVGFGLGRRAPAVLRLRSDGPAAVLAAKVEL
jgi:hypothetical protein